MGARRGVNVRLRTATRQRHENAMKKPKASNDTRSNAHELTLTQQNAVDLLAAGKNAPDTAAALNVNRVTVTRGRLYSPEFRAALADRRAAVWGAAADRLRALIPQALEALAEALDDDNHRIPVALALLKLAGPLPILPADSTDPEDYVRQEVARERSLTPSTAARILARANGYRDDDEHAANVRPR